MPIMALDVRVVATENEGIPDVDKRVFLLKVCFGNSRMTVIRRSYSDFVNLDVLLRQRFPLSTGAHQMFGEFPTLSDRRKGSIESWSYSPVAKGEDNHHGTNTAIGTEYIEDLNFWLATLLCRHEILSAHAFLSFLDPTLLSYPQILSYEKDKAFVYDVNQHMAGLLLMDTSEQRCIVKNRGKLEFTFDVSPNQIVIWRFSTQKYDIGFGMMLCGRKHMEAVRYDSHLRPQISLLHVDFYGQVSLVFENSYSLLRSKHLFVSAAVRSRDEFERAQTMVNDYLQRQQQHHQDRDNIQATAHQRALSLSGIVYDLGQLTSDRGLEVGKTGERGEIVEEMGEEMKEGERESVSSSSSSSSSVEKQNKINVSMAQEVVRLTDAFMLWQQRAITAETTIRQLTFREQREKHTTDEHSGNNENNNNRSTDPLTYSSCYPSTTTPTFPPYESRQNEEGKWRHEIMEELTAMVNRVSETKQRLRHGNHRLTTPYLCTHLYLPPSNIRRSLLLIPN